MLRDERAAARLRSSRLANQAEPSFHDGFVELFGASFPRLFRYLDRLSREPELAADIAQEAFVRLYRRGSFPERPDAWLITVAMNLFRNDRSTRERRRALLTMVRGERAHSDPPPSPGERSDANHAGECVRRALEKLPARDRRMLLLRAEGYGYRDIAEALDLHEASVGTLLARARDAFRAAYEDAADAR